METKGRNVCIYSIRWDQIVEDFGCPDEELTLGSLFTGTPLGVDELGCRLSQPQDY